MGGAEAVKIVQEGDTAAQGRGLGDQGKVHDLLYIVGTEESPAGGAAGHDVGMVAEYGQRLGGDSAGRNMENRGCKFAGNLEHVRDHQEQTLAGGEGCGQSACLQGSVDSACCATLRLHFYNGRHVAPDVLLSHGAFGV